MKYRLRRSFRPFRKCCGTHSSAVSFRNPASGSLVPAFFMFFLPEMRAHPIGTIAIAATLVTVAMWLKRYIIIVPTLYNPRMPIQNVPFEWAHYTPTWVEWSITAGGLAMFILLYTLFSKTFPIVSVWETSETKHASGPVEGEGNV